MIAIITTDPNKIRLSDADAHIILDSPMEGPVFRMQQIYDQYSPKEIGEFLVLVHDDVLIHEPQWYPIIQTMFAQYPRAAVIGLGGATSIGEPDLYKTPYRIQNLIRHNYASNQTDWAIHGKQFLGERKAAVLDGFFLAIRWKFLQEIGGFSWMQTRFHCYDLALCLEAWRRGWEVWQVGISCTHFGGGTSCQPEYVEWCEKNGTTAEREHAEPHKWLASRYQDLLPFSVEDK